jgi:hypothetical protein
MIITYNKAKHLIQEADVLLFKHGGFPSIGWWIGLYSQSPYSHVGLAHWDQGQLYCLEFREFHGARKYPMYKYVRENPNRIDVFRACLCVQMPIIDNDYMGPHNDCKDYKLTDTIRNRITQSALKLMGTKYGYKLILKILKTYIPFVRLWRKPKFEDDNGNIYVCSTLVTRTYRQHYIDPVDCLADEYTKPGDIARSAIFHKLFSITS